MNQILKEIFFNSASDLLENLAFITIFWKPTRLQGNKPFHKLAYISLINKILKANYFDSESDSASKFSIYYNILIRYEEAINCEVDDYN